MILLTAYLLVLVLLSVYSYALIDPNLTLVSHPFWEAFREKIVYFGYYQRQYSWYFYLVAVLTLFAFHYLFVKSSGKQHVRPFLVAMIVSVGLFLSYPFLSHDFFSYLFDAKIFTFYHKNPYFYKPGDFYLDPWLRFTQWTDRSYPYGPVFLLISAIPSFLGMGKFLLSFLFMKGAFFLFYLLAVYLFERLNRKWAMIVATHPLVIVEGLMNSHNDLIAMSLGIIGIYFLMKKKGVVARIWFLFSAGIKYMTTPLLALTRNSKKSAYISFAATVGVLGYLTFKSEIQPWYFLVLFPFLPYFESLVVRLSIFFAGLLFSYYPYVRYGGWDKIIGWTSEQKVLLKHQIIFVFFVLNAGYILFVAIDSIVRSTHRR